MLSFRSFMQAGRVRVSGHVPVHTIYVAGYDGLFYKSTDGVTFAPFSIGTTKAIRKVAILKTPDQKPVAFAVGEQGLLLRSYDGLTWTQVAMANAPSQTMIWVDIAQAPNGTITLIGQLNTTATATIARTTNAGDTWDVRSFGPSGTALQSFDFASDGVLLATYSGDKITYLTAANAATTYSVSASTNWNKVKFANGFFWIAGSAGKLYQVNINPDAASFISKTPGTASASITDLAYKPAASTILGSTLSVTQATRSVNNGSTFAAVNHGQNFAGRAVHFDPTTNAFYMAGAASGNLRISKSADGATFTALTSGSSATVTSIASGLI